MALAYEIDEGRQEPTVEAEADPGVSFGEWYDDGTDETGPWCVDHGSSIEVMRTAEIYRQVEAGLLALDTKVWRDGRAGWLPICECCELTVAPDREETPPRSGVRRIARPLSPIPTDLHPPRLEARSLLLIASALLCGLLLGLLVLPRHQPTTPRVDAAFGKLMHAADRMARR